MRHVTGKEVVTTELGQYTASPAWVTGILTETERLKIPIVIWFNGDGSRAIALANQDGGLRENGKAFATFTAGLKK